jgi:phosphatidylglycerophosphate synthase
MQRLAIVPSIISILRIVALPPLLYLFDNGYTTLGLVLFLFLGFTDLLDGYLARKLKVNSEIGAFFDSAVDFILILSIFIFFTEAGFYPIWISGLIIFAFCQFVFSSLYSKRLYDPVGKYYGSFLYIAIALTCAFPTQLVCNMVVIAFITFAAISFSSRVAHFLGVFPRERPLKH